MRIRAWGEVPTILLVAAGGMFAGAAELFAELLAVAMKLVKIIMEPIEIGADTEVGLTVVA